MSTLLCALVMEVDPARNRRRMAGYRGGICVNLAHERGHMRLFSRLPDGRRAAASGANHARQRWFSPVDAELRQTLPLGLCSCALRKDADALLAFFDFPAEHWKHLRTTNMIESPFATVRLRQRVTKGAGSRTKGLLMTYKLLDMAQTRW